MTTKRTNTTSSPTPMTLTDGGRSVVISMIQELGQSLDHDCADDLAERIARELSTRPGSDTAEALLPLIKGMPSTVAEKLPAILHAAGAPAKTAVLSHFGKDVVYRMQTAITYGKAFLALTDLRCDPTRPSEWN
jgi:hypothetical protein